MGPAKCVPNNLGSLKPCWPNSILPPTKNFICLIKTDLIVASHLLLWFKEKEDKIGLIKFNRSINYHFKDKFKKNAVFHFQLLKNVFFYLNFVKTVCYNRVSVCYNQEGSVFDSPKPNQALIFVHYKREFAITEFVITEFHFRTIYLSDR
jgi:hypothetical protein